MGGQPIRAAPSLGTGRHVSVGLTQANERSATPVYWHREAASWTGGSNSWWFMSRTWTRAKTF